MDLKKYHFVKRFHEQCEKYKEREALFKKIGSEWIPISWNEFKKQATQLSLQMVSHGVNVQEKIAIFSQNMPEWTIADMAIMQARAVTVPIYATNTADQAAYIINDSGAKWVFAGAQDQYDHIISIIDQCPTLEKIVAMRSNIDLKNHEKACYWDELREQSVSEETQQELQKRIDEISLDDLFTLIYTSGTTGNPKGVMLDYSNLAFQLTTHDERLHIDDTDISLAFLPLTHIFERCWSAFVLHRGAVNYFLEDTNLVKEALQEVRPTVMSAVPRFYEKIYATVYDTVSRSSLPKRMIFSFAVKTGKKMLQTRLDKKEPSFILKKSHALAHKLVYKKFQQLLGGRIKFMPCGGAKLEPSIGAFFHAIGINVKLGYGLTESTATVSCWGDKYFDLLSVGEIMPDTEVKIGENSEILVKGGMVMKGYYNLPEETKKAFTEDGFLRTGDAGSIDDKGNIFITDRIKELMKTSTGKYISPQHVEGKVGKDNLIEQIAVIADGKNYVTALIVPNYEALSLIAKEEGIKEEAPKQWIHNEKVIQLYTQRIQRFQHGLAEYEKIKKFTLLEKPFTIENNEITPTLKLKRKFIYQHYKTEIDAMYNR